MLLPITTIFTSAIAIWLLTLSWNVIRQRNTAKVPLSDGGDDLLLRRIRAQANLTEYAPIMILMVALAEYQDGNLYFVALVAAVFFIARLMHGYALSFSSHSPKGRFYGAAFTFLAIGVLALHNLLIFLFLG